MTIDNAVSAYEFASDFDISNPTDSLSLIMDLYNDEEVESVDSSALDTFLSYFDAAA